MGDHDESASGPEEVYVVTEGSARFRVGEVEQVVPAGSIVAPRDPTVRRSATALSAGTKVLAIGGPARDRFESTWNASHFEGIERFLD